jgi:hypothetical protein
MTPPNDLRLLPWSGPEGKPCYLSTDQTGGFMSRLADNIEAVQLGTATELLDHASEALDDQDTGPGRPAPTGERTGRGSARRAPRCRQPRAPIGG